MMVKSDNDVMKASKHHYHFLGGGPQDAVEQKTLQTCEMPGVNKRRGMPEKATCK